MAHYSFPWQRHVSDYYLIWWHEWLLISFLAELPVHRIDVLTYWLLPLHSLWLWCQLQLLPADGCVHPSCAGSPDCRLAPCCAMQSHTLPPSYCLYNTDLKREKHIWSSGHNKADIDLSNKHGLLTLYADRYETFNTGYIYTGNDLIS